MTDVEHENSGELSSFLHLTGWRPVILALLAGIAGAAGLYLALGEPAQWQSRYVVNARDVADDQWTPNQVSLFADEIVVDMKLPQTIAAVEDTTGLVEESDYEIIVRQSASSSALIDVNVVSDSPETSRMVAVETAVIGLNVTLQSQRNALAATVQALDADLAAEEAREAELIAEVNGLNPTTAFNRAQNQYLDRQDFMNNRPSIVAPDDDGNLVTQPAPEPDGPSLEELRAEVERLEPIAREYAQVRVRIDDLNLRIADRRDSIREFDGAIAGLELEREFPSVVQEVETEEASRITSILTGVLLFAVPVALLTILLFVLFDLLFRRGDDELTVADPIDTHGVLDASSQPALPESSVITTLVVVDEEGGDAPGPVQPEAPNPPGEVYDVDEELDDFDDHDDDGPRPGTKSKASRWGRDASSKAG